MRVDGGDRVHAHVVHGVSDSPSSNPSVLIDSLVSLSTFAPCLLIKARATSTLPQMTASIKGDTPLPRLPDFRLFSSSVADSTGGWDMRGVTNFSVVRNAFR